MTRLSFDKSSKATGISNADRIPLTALDRCRDLLSAHGGFEDLIHLSNAEIVASGFLTVHLVIDVVTPGDAFEEGCARSLDALQSVLHL